MIERTNDRAHVAWDIETTGFAWSDQITVSGFWFPGANADLIINTSGKTLDAEYAEQHLKAVSDGVSVTVTVADDEPTLLETIQEIIFQRFDREYNRLVAFNAESWKSGFDLPFLRTRCFRHDFSWLFDGLSFADLWDPIKKRMNTTHTAYGNSNSINSLTGTYSLLFDEPHPTTLLSGNESEMSHPWYCDTQYDPFENSGSAVSCYKRNEFIPILQHNLADIHRTWELGELVRMFVSPKDITTKKL